MIKISLCILAVYLLYYSGNILYDLFLKKEKEVRTDEMEEFSLSEISEQYEAAAINMEIEDVENLSTPKSFNKNRIHSDFGGKDERQDLEHLRKQYEAEQDLEPQMEDKTENTEYLASKDEIDIQLESSKDLVSSIQKSNKDKWHQLLNLAETSVQLIANQDGCKIYQSTM